MQSGEVVEYITLDTKQVSDWLMTCLISVFMLSSSSYEKFPSVQAIFRLFYRLISLKLRLFPGLLQIFFLSTNVQIRVLRPF